MYLLVLLGDRKDFCLAYDGLEYDGVRDLFPNLPGVRPLVLGYEVVLLGTNLLLGAVI